MGKNNVLVHKISDNQVFNPIIEHPSMLLREAMRTSSLINISRWKGFELKHPLPASNTQWLWQTYLCKPPVQALQIHGTSDDPRSRKMIGRSCNLVGTQAIVS
ncbi:hypothetical protein [Bombiscardovia coagulans]|uniref:Uncharacterized protein n=1 Tax=Bombiscardovia coagulans TaxID=686666 RepID=A0A261ETP1_9BIFI|nr:hypothetical protein [Bombiscardovia coagulans]OZG50242.1 hypothetical protein BOCO_0759 [Bombiscardovia coagulans]